MVGVCEIQGDDVYRVNMDIRTDHESIYDCEICFSRDIRGIDLTIGRP